MCAIWTLTNYRLENHQKNIDTEKEWTDMWIITHFFHPFKSVAKATTEHSKRKKKSLIWCSVKNLQPIHPGGWGVDYKK